MLNNKVEKIRYSTSGVLLNRIIDTFDDNSLIRSDGLKDMYIKDNNVIKVNSPITFKALEKYKSNKKFSWLPNPNIGVIDIETYVNNNGINEVYAIGFKTKLSDSPVVHYIENNYDSNTLVLKVINELLRSKYSDITFYCHNLGGYDVVFIIKTLYTYNLKHKIYNIHPTLKDNKVIKLTIKKDDNSLNILDSYSMLTSSLEKLGKDFGVKTLKSVFPYKFSTQDHLFYKGHTPDKHFYNNLSDKEYNNIYQEYWSYKDETLKYFKNDLNCLYEIIVSANNQVFEDYKINLMDSITISGLAVKIFLKNYYNDNIPTINKPSIYKDIKNSYYGGITEVYKPFFINKQVFLIFYVV